MAVVILEAHPLTIPVAHSTIAKLMAAAIVLEMPSASASQRQSALDTIAEFTGSNGRLIG